ncbi:MAG: hypothetical protein ACK5HO_14285 [Pseudomonadota bacterium]
MPVKLARLLLDITIGCCFDSHPRIDSVLQNSGFRYGLLENTIGSPSMTISYARSRRACRQAYTRHLIYHHQYAVARLYLR